MDPFDSVERKLSLSQKVYLTLDICRTLICTQSMICTHSCSLIHSHNDLRSLIYTHVSLISDETVKEFIVEFIKVKNFGILRLLKY